MTPIDGTITTNDRNRDREGARARGHVLREARATRARKIRRRVVAGALALFVATWLMIAVVLVSGHDPALAARKSSATTGVSTSGTTTSASSSGTTGASSSGTTGASSSGTSGASTSGGSGSSVTTRQS